MKMKTLEEIYQFQPIQEKTSGGRFGALKDFGKKAKDEIKRLGKDAGTEIARYTRDEFRTGRKRPGEGLLRSGKGPYKATFADLDFDPEDPTVPVKLRSERDGKKITTSPAAALDIFKFAQQQQSSAVKKTGRNVDTARANLEKAIEGGEKSAIDLAKSKLQAAERAEKRALSRPAPDIEDFVPERATGRKVGRSILNFGTSVAAALGTQAAGALGDQVKQQMGSVGGEAQAAARAEQGLENVGRFVSSLAFGDSKADVTDDTVKRFGIGGSALGGTIKAAEQLLKKRRLGAMSAADVLDRQRIQKFTQSPRLRDIITQTRRSLGTSPYTRGEIKN